MTVISVNVLTTKAKEKRRGTKRGRIVGHTTPWRKAIVTLAPGQKIKFSRESDRCRFEPTSRPRRASGQMTRSTFEEITAEEHHKPLLEPQIRGSGRNNQGRLTVRHRGGGEKQHYRRIDFKRDKTGVPARVATIEYDPNRSGRIGLLHYRDGEKRYMLLPHGLRVGDVVVAGPDAEARVGNTLPLANIPLGTTIHNIELTPGKGGRIVRSAGTSAQLLAKEGD